jgi:hypothetical protein
MRANMLFQVSASLFNIAQLLKYMELGECCFQGPRHFPVSIGSQYVCLSGKTGSDRCGRCRETR